METGVRVGGMNTHTGVRAVVILCCCCPPPPPRWQAFMTFADTADAVAASTEMIDSKMGKSLKKFLTKNIVKKELKDKVGVVWSWSYGSSPAAAVGVACR